MDEKKRRQNDESSSGKKSRRLITRSCAKQCMENDSDDFAGSNMIIHATDTDIPAEDRVFAIDLILSKIFSYMSTHQLKTCRLVCHRWNTVTLKVFAKYKSLRLCSFYKGEDSLEVIGDHEFRFGIIHNHAKTERPLKDLINVMDISQSFPVSHFCFQDGCIKNPLLQKFFNSHGTRIKRLCLHVYSSNYGYIDERGKNIPTLTTLKTLLTSQAPNIQRLRMDELPALWKSESTEQIFLRRSGHSGPSSSKDSGAQNIHTLPSLQILELPQDTPVRMLNEIVEAAVNLKQLDIIDGNIDFFLASKKFHLLKNMIFAPTRETLESYAKIALENVRLEKIKLFVSVAFGGVEIHKDLWPRTAQVLHQLLVSSCETLKKIKWMPVGFLPDLNIPVMANVTKLKIFENMYPPIPHSKTKRIFPRGLSLSKVFPNLTTVNIDISPREEQATSDYFDSNYDPIPTVRNISIDRADRFSPAFMNILFPQIFPNAISGKFEHLKKISQGLQGIWKFRQLEQLELTFDVGTPATGQATYSIDPFFTGVSEDNCDKLRSKRSKKNIDLHLIENPSITELKQLANLKLHFYDDSEYERIENEDYALLLSNITGQYGFELCPQLQISVFVDADAHQNVHRLVGYLSPLRLYVHYGPWK